MRFWTEAGSERVGVVEDATDLAVEVRPVARGSTVANQLHQRRLRQKLYFPLL